MLLNQKKIWDYQLSVIEMGDNSILSKNVSIKKIKGLTI